MRQARVRLDGRLALHSGPIVLSEGPSARWGWPQARLALFICLVTRAGCLARGKANALKIGDELASPPALVWLAVGPVSRLSAPQLVEARIA